MIYSPFNRFCKSSRRLVRKISGGRKLLRSFKIAANVDTLVIDDQGYSDINLESEDFNINVDGGDGDDDYLLDSYLDELAKDCEPQLRTKAALDALGLRRHLVVSWSLTPENADQELSRFSNFVEFINQNRLHLTARELVQLLKGLVEKALHQVDDYLQILRARHLEPGTCIDYMYSIHKCLKFFWMYTEEGVSIANQYPASIATIDDKIKTIQKRLRQQVSMMTVIHAYIILSQINICSDFTCLAKAKKPK